MASTNGAVTNVSPATYGRPSVIVSAKGAWVTAHANASATAQTAAELIRPFNVSSSNVIPFKLGQLTRCLFRCRYGAAGAVTTSPVIRVFACYGDIATGATTIVDDATIRSIIVASAQTLTCVAATDVRDTTYSYSAPLSLSGSDMLGGDFGLVFIETAASITGATPIIEVLTLN